MRIVTKKTERPDPVAAVPLALRVGISTYISAPILYTGAALVRRAERIFRLFPSTGFPTITEACDIKPTDKKQRNQHRLLLRPGDGNE